MITELNKKNAKQEFKDSPSAAGVYLIRNTITNMRLLLSAQNARGALNRHQFELRYHQHRNRRMQAEWNEYGEAAFEFILLKNVKPDEKNIKEALSNMLDEYKQQYGSSDSNTWY